MVALIAYAVIVLLVVFAVRRSATGEERARHAQVATGAVVRLQLDEETGMRGYALAQKRGFLQPYERAAAQFGAVMANANAAVTASGARDALSALSDEAQLHRRWVHDVARPLIENPRRHNAVALEIEGKRLMDRFRRDGETVGRDLNAAASQSDESGRRLVDALVAGGIVLGLAIVGAMVAAARRQRRIQNAARQTAILYEHERKIANQLQNALLMRDLPTVPGLTIHARYRPADEPERLGGDWYDVFRLPTGRIFIIVGDAVGHGIVATMTMSGIRNAIIAAALHETRAGEILTAANHQLLLKHPDEPVGTAVCAFVDSATGEIEYAAAGHPPPLLFQRAGDVRWLSCAGSLPLAFQECEYRTYKAVAQPGAIAVFYTDGLTEFSRDVYEGEARLVEAVAAASAERAPNTALFIKRRILQDAPYLDDVAIVTVAFSTQGVAPTAPAAPISVTHLS
jgi:serine phosphatase RsbU (regulator of sigma subunit)